MRKLRVLVCVLPFLMALVLGGCGGSPIMVSASATTGSLQAGGTTRITATLTNDSSNKGITWSVTCSIASCGSVSPTSSTSWPYITTYTAPSTPPASNLTVTVMATSGADSTKTATATVTVQAIGVSVSTNSSSTVAAGQAAQVTGTVTNDLAAGGVTWSLSCGTAPCGGLSPATTASGVAATYTAPAAAPASDLAVTITATSVTDSTKSASTTITVMAIAVSMISSTSHVGATGTAQVTGTVANDPATGGVSWSVTCTTAPCGSVSPTTTASGVAATYTAPAAAPASDLAVTIMATSVTDGSKSATTTITVQAITVSLSTTTVTVLVSTTQNFTATVSNDPASAGVSWTLMWSGSDCTVAATCGSLTNMTTTSVTYNPPATVPTPATVTLTATSVTDGTKTQTSTITITTLVCGAGGSESLLNGHYAFLLKGFDGSSEPVVIGGVLTANGSGGVTAGTMDMNLSAGVQTALNVTSGTYTVNSDHRGCMSLTTSTGTRTYRFSLGGPSAGAAINGHMIGFDTTGPFTSGVILKQDTTAFSTSSVTGNFAFGASSLQNSAAINDNNVHGGKFAVVGVLNLATGSVNGGVFDDNWNGELDDTTSNTNWPATPNSFDSGGAYAIDGTSGRGTLTFTPSGSTAVHNAIYVVSSTEFLDMTTDAQTSNVIFGGTAVKQRNGPFSNSTLDGTNSVFSLSGLGSGGAGSTRAQLGLAVTGGGGAFTFSSYQNDSGTFSSETGVAGMFSSTDPTTGRVMISGAAAGDHPPVLYIGSPSQGFLLDSDDRVTSGVQQFQDEGVVFTASDLNGTYAFGSIDPGDPTVDDTSGVATFDGISAFTGTNDTNSSGTLERDGAISDTYSMDSNGLVHDGSGCTVTATSTTCKKLFIFLSPYGLVMMETESTNKHPKIYTLDP